MKIASINTEQETLVVAEIGNNHEGSYALAEELVGLVAETGAQVVKFQTFQTKHFISSSNAARFERLKGFELSYSDFERLAAHARRAGLIFMSTPLDLESADFLNTLVPAFKIASGDNNYFELLERICGFKKPIILSTGMSDDHGIARSVEHILKTSAILGWEPELALLHCVGSYPAPDEQANLASIPFLKARFQTTVGYSDHTLGIENALFAVAAGAQIVEKHFTKDKNYSSFRDHQLSATPSELKELVSRIKNLERVLGRFEKEIQPCEQSTIPAARRAAVARRDLKAGHVLQKSDFQWLRAGSLGIAADREDLILGKTLRSTCIAGDPLTLAHFEVLHSEART